MRLTGVILAGGNGKRLGFDKARLAVNGQPALLLLTKVLADFASEIVVAIGKKRVLDFPLPTEVKVVEDLFPACGPLAGLHAGLFHASFPVCLTVACDAPFLSPTLLARLVEDAELAKLAVFSVRGFIEPFPGLYPRSVLPKVEKALRSGKLGMQDFLRSVRAKILGEEEARLADSALSSFINVNTAEDLARCGV